MNKLQVTADTLVSTGLGKLHTLSIAPTTATPTAGLLSVYDHTTEAGTVIYSEWVFATTPGHTVTLDCDVYAGIYVGFDATLAEPEQRATNFASSRPTCAWLHFGEGGCSLGRMNRAQGAGDRDIANSGRTAQ